MVQGKANKVIEENMICLSIEAKQKILRAIEAPPEPTEALKTLFKKHERPPLSSYPLQQVDRRNRLLCGMEELDYPVPSSLYSKNRRHSYEEIPVPICGQESHQR